MRRPGLIVHHTPNDFHEDSDYFKSFQNFEDLNTSSNIRHYDLGDGARLSIGQTLTTQDSDSDSEDSSNLSYPQPLGQRIMNLGQDRGFFTNEGSEIKREQFNLKTPFVQLVNGFHANEQIRLVGKHTSSRWAIDLCRGNDRMLHVNPRLDEKCIVRNNFKNGRWNKEERSGGMQIKKSHTFTMDLVCNSNGNAVSILINGDKLCDFEIRESLQQADRLEISSGVEVHMLGLYDEDD